MAETQTLMRKGTSKEVSDFLPAKKTLDKNIQIEKSLAKRKRKGEGGRR